MRVRKTINFYYSEPAHAELLEYLDSIEGASRRQAQLLQMALIGFRVMANQESGMEALFKTRNPDISPLLQGKPRILIEGGLPKVKRVGEKKSVPARVPGKAPAHAKDEESITREPVAESPVTSAGISPDTHRGSAGRSSVIPRGMVPRPDPPSAEDDMDPLLKLQQLIDQ